MKKNNNGNTNHWTFTFSLNHNMGNTVNVVRRTPQARYVHRHKTLRGPNSRTTIRAIRTRPTIILLLQLVFLTSKPQWPIRVSFLHKSSSALQTSCFFSPSTLLMTLRLHPVQMFLCSSSSSSSTSLHCCLHLQLHLPCWKKVPLSSSHIKGST